MVAMFVAAGASVAGAGSARAVSADDVLPHYNRTVDCNDLGFTTGGSVRPQAIYGGRIESTKRCERTEIVERSLPKAYAWVEWTMIDLSWDVWSADTAHATGQLKVAPRSAALDSDPSATLLPIEITLSGRVDCGGVPLFTSYTLTLPEGQTPPMYFDLYRTRNHRCRVMGLPSGDGKIGLLQPTLPGGYSRGQLQSKADRPTTSGPIPCKGDSPGRWFESSDLCRSYWQNWTGTTATGKGIWRRNRVIPRVWSETRDFGVKVVFSSPTWCEGLGVVYGHETFTTYGDGIVNNGHATPDGKGFWVTGAEVRKLYSQIGRAGVKHRTYTSSLTGRERKKYACE
ncbi:MAG TPA: hypothetical protein VNS09_04330 [Solirubrobacter sp.]|nr:hypothetical protein [Solirubrobacter sp.]